MFFLVDLNHSRSCRCGVPFEFRVIIVFFTQNWTFWARGIERTHPYLDEKKTWSKNIIFSWRKLILKKIFWHFLNIFEDFWELRAFTKDSLVGSTKESLVLLLVSAPQGRRGATGQRNTLGARRDRGNSPRDPKKHLPWQCYYLYGRLQKGVYPLLPGTLHPI